MKERINWLLKESKGKTDLLKKYTAKPKVEGHDDLGLCEKQKTKQNKQNNPMRTQCCSERQQAFGLTLKISVEISSLSFSQIFKCFSMMLTTMQMDI